MGFNRLAIAHQLGWMLVTALLMAVYRYTYDAMDLGNGDNPIQVRTNRLLWIDAAAQIGVAPFEAAALCGLGLLVVGGPKFVPNEPGHVVLVVLGSFVVSRLPCELTWRWMVLLWFDNPDTIDRDFRLMMAIWDVCDGFPFLMAAAVLGYFLWRHSLTLSWRAALVLGLAAMLGWTAVEGLNIAGYRFFPIAEWTEWLSWLAGFLAACSMLAAAGADLVRRRRRDLMHYVGVVAVVGAAVHALVQPIALRMVVPG